MDIIRNKYIRGAVLVRCFGEKVRGARLTWFGHVQRRDSEYNEYTPPKSINNLSWSRVVEENFFVCERNGSLVLCERL